jgi:hypothetical protein
MKLKLYLGAVLALSLAAALPGCSRQTEPQTFTDLPALITAIQTFSQEVSKKGEALPASVSLSELTAGGYISTNSVSAFEGMDTKIWLKAKPGDPQAVLMSAQLVNGSVNAVLADGGLRSFSTRQFAEHLSRTGQN